MISYSPNLADIRASIDVAENILGREFVSKYLNVSARHDRFSEHPLAKQRRTLFKLMDETVGNRITNYYFEAVEYLLFCTLISKVKDEENIEEILAEIRNPASFYNGFFELFVLAFYLSAGFQISKKTNKTTDNFQESRRVCDFAIKFPDGCVYVECKNLENHGLSIEKHWYRLSERIGRLSLQRNRKLDLRLRLFLSRLDGKLSDKIFTLIKENIDADSVFSLAKNSEFLINLSSSPNECGVDIIESNFLIAYDKLESLRDRVIKQVKKAIKQLPRSGPGVIYINLPLQFGRDFIELIDLTYDRVFAEINNNTTRVNSVVLTALIRQAANSPIDHYSQVIPNYNARAKYPACFQIDNYGPNCDLDIHLEASSGAFSANLLKTLHWDKNIAETLLFFSRNQGEWKLHVWKRWDKRLRLEIIRPDHGRQVLDTDPVELVDNQEIVVDVLWNSDVVGLGFLGKIFRST